MPGIHLVVAVDDVLVHLGAAVHVVGLDRSAFLQRVRRAVGLERPDFHLAEALAAELRLAAERLLVTSEYGPVERACILSSTRWFSLSMYM